MKIAYWTTSSLEPEYEAVSKEVFRLADHFKESWIFAVSPHYLARFSWSRRYVGLTEKAYPLLRAVIPCLERTVAVNHVYGLVSPWLFHKSLRRRPLIHTVTEYNGQPVVEFLNRCSAIVAQSAATRDSLLSLGLPQNRVHLRYPGIDLEEFKPQPGRRRPGRPLRILFATAPRSREEMDGRGVNLLLRAAALDKNLHFRFLFRPWRTGYTSLDATRKAIAEAGLENIELTNHTVTNMSQVYPECDFTIIPYTSADGGKECPTSALESLACGVPVLVSRKCGFSTFVREHDCGVVFEPTPEGTLRAATEAAMDWERLSLGARRAAEAHLDIGALLTAYERLYEAAQETNLSSETVSV